MSRLSSVVHGMLGTVFGELLLHFLSRLEVLLIVETLGILSLLLLLELDLIHLRLLDPLHVEFGPLHLELQILALDLEGLALLIEFVNILRELDSILQKVLLLDFLDDVSVDLALDELDESVKVL